MQRLPIALMVVSYGLLSSGAAFAGDVHQYPDCRKQPSETDIQGAKGAFQAGSVSFNEADYERAILYWEDAFRRDCTATLLLHHLARAYEGQGNLQQAVVALKAYLERTPDAAERPQIQRRIEVFTQKIQEEEQRAAKAAEERAAKSNPAPASTPNPNEASKPNPLDMKLRVNPIIPIAVGAVGVASTIVGAIIYFPASSDLDDYRARCPDGECPSDSITSEAQSAESRRNWGAAVGITGLLLAAGGTGWYFFNEVQSPATTNKAPAFQPWLGPQLAGLSYAGTF